MRGGGRQSRLAARLLLRRISLAVPRASLPAARSRICRFAPALRFAPPPLHVVSWMGCEAGPDAQQYAVRDSRTGSKSSYSSIGHRRQAWEKEREVKPSASDLENVSCLGSLDCAAGLLCLRQGQARCARACGSLDLGPPGGRSRDVPRHRPRHSASVRDEGDGHAESVGGRDSGYGDRLADRCCWDGSLMAPSKRCLPSPKLPLSSLVDYGSG
jgi:hypothetical protein